MTPPASLRVFLMSDCRRLPDPTAMLAQLPAGSVMVLRHYDATDRHDLGQRLRHLTRLRGQKLLLAGADWQLAEQLGADGLHLPEKLARHGVLAPLLRWCQNKERVLSIAAHSLPALARAATLKADFVLLSPIFPTESHPKAPTLGVVKLRIWSQIHTLPIVALGGINADTLACLRHSGVTGVAFGSAMKSCCLAKVKRGKLWPQPFLA